MVGTVGIEPTSLIYESQIYSLARLHSGLHPLVDPIGFEPILSGF